MEQKIYITKSVIRASIAYGFYVVAFCPPTIEQLDDKLITLQKSICDISNSVPNITTQLLHDLFGLNVFSLKN